MLLFVGNPLFFSLFILSFLLFICSIFLEEVTIGQTTLCELEDIIKNHRLIMVSWLDNGLFIRRDQNGDLFLQNKGLMQQ